MNLVRNSKKQYLKNSNRGEFSNGVKIHFVGIGGIGVSALAKYYLEKGHKISGSDLVSSETTKALKEKGAKIFIGKHKNKNLSKDANLVVFSPAVPSNNLELKEAKRLKIKCQSYPEALGELTKKHYTIAISGTHGKSTTTAMIGLLLEKAGLDPTVIVGTKLKEWENSNCRVGESEYLVIEADEWQASFLNYWPQIIVLTNIEREHLDYFKDLNHILRAYKQFISHLFTPHRTCSGAGPQNGILIANKDDKKVYRICQKISDPIHFEFFSMNQNEAKKLKNILKIPGKHNISNSLAALTVARALKIPDKISFKALSKYRGSWRRFEIEQLTINNKQLTIISDYAHHPTEIRVTLKAAREKFPKKKIWCIFQPHQHQRTHYLWDDFVKVFKKALGRSPTGEAPIDRLIITDIYDVAGREKKEIQEKISSKKLIEAINKRWAIYLPKEKIRDFLKKNLEGREVVIIMGAGDIYKTIHLTGDY